MIEPVGQAETQPDPFESLPQRDWGVQPPAEHEPPTPPPAAAVSGDVFDPFAYLYQ